MLFLLSEYFFKRKLYFQAPLLSGFADSAVSFFILLVEKTHARFRALSWASADSLQLVGLPIMPFCGAAKSSV